MEIFLFLAAGKKRVSPEFETKSQIRNEVDLSTRKQMSNPFEEFIEKLSPRDQSDYRNRNPFENDDLNPFLTTESDQTACLQESRKEGSQYKSLTSSESFQQENTAITGESLEERLHFTIKYLNYLLLIKFPRVQC